MGSIIKIILYAVLIIALAYILPGITVSGFWPAALIAGVAFAILNAIIRAILPDGILFAVVVVILNAIAIWFIGVYVPGFDVATYMDALLAGLLGGIGAWLISTVL